MQDKIVREISNIEVLNSLDDVFRGKEIFLVGGALRDLISKKKSTDFDLVTLNFSPSIMADEIINKLGGTKILLDAENQIYRVVLRDKTTYFDISQAYLNDIQKDIKRRDFRANSLFYDINKKKIVNPDVISDIENKFLRLNDISNLSDDPLRLLRALRFMACDDFKIEAQIIDFIKNNGALIRKPAPERVNQELIKMMGGKNLVNTLILMHETHFLNEIFEIFDEVDKIPKNTHHHLPLTLHSIETVKNLQSDNPLLNLAALLHDIGKPACFTIDLKTNRHRFIGHEKVGGELARKILKKLKFSKKQIDYIALMIENHIYPSALMQNDCTKRAMIRFLSKMGDNFCDCIALARADRLSARGEAITDFMVQNNLKNLEILQNFCIQTLPTLKTLPKLLDGNEISALTGKKGRALGEIISKLKDAQMEGSVQTKDEATRFVKDYQ